ncbi:unnamed protein product, partial [Pylaiella littoralis]
KKDTPCGKLSGGRVVGLSKHHDGKQQRRRTPAAQGGEAQAGAAGGDDESNYGSDEEVGGGVDECDTRGAATNVEKEQGAHYRKAS